MPLNKTKELAQVVDESILPLEHSGGDGWTILHGDIETHSIEMEQCLQAAQQEEQRRREQREKEEQQKEARNRDNQKRR